jgi:hypothetical protein
MTGSEAIRCPNDTNGKQSYVAGRFILDVKPSDGL